MVLLNTEWSLRKLSIKMIGPSLEKQARRNWSFPPATRSTLSAKRRKDISFMPIRLSKTGFFVLKKRKFQIFGEYLIKKGIKQKS
jgi:hypothetical protein